MADMNHTKLCLGCMADKGDAKTCPGCGLEQNPGPASSHHLPPGTILQNKYLIGKVLGQGGFGITYLAWDKTLDLKLAVKEFFPMGLVARSAGSPTVDAYEGSHKEQFTYGLERFLSEAKTLARFSEHPNIVTVRDFFQANSTAYMVMNYIEGQTLEEYLKQAGGKIVFSQMLDIMMPVMDALREVHQAGFMHRDISPDNIFIRNDGRVILIDFGAARQDLQSRSRSLSVILKVGYSPEEQYRSRGEQGPWTDVYAVAATIYRGITGEAPPESMDRLADDNLMLPSKLKVYITDEQESVLLKALEIRAFLRFQTIEAFQKALSNKLSEEEASRVRTVDKSAMIIDSQHSNNQLERSGKPSVDWHIKDNRSYRVEQSKSKANESNVEGLKRAPQQDEQVNKKSDSKAPSTNSRWLLIGSLLIVAIIFSLLFLSLPDPKVTALYLNYNTLELEHGSNVRLEVDVEPAGATVDELNWWSSDPSVAQVLSSGFISPSSKGVATITVQDKNTGIKDQCKVTVVYPTVTDYSFHEGLYTGTLKNLRPHGEGTWVHSDGYEYKGEWKEGQRHGQGTATFANGNKYVGEFKDDQPHGQGTYTFANGDKYIGEFKDNMFHGQGTYTFVSGNKHVGEYKDDQPHGQGTYTFANGDKYVGEFKDGQFHGQGTHTFANGDKYVGEFKDGLANGQGTATFANGDKYVGEWKDGIFHGQGTYTFADGKVSSGKWENDEYVGP